MTADDVPTTVDDAQELADFGAGFDGKKAEKPPSRSGESGSRAPNAGTTTPEQPDPAATPRAEETPEYVQITAKDWAEVQAAARRTASYDGQFSKLFGTTGNLQKLVNAFQAQTPSGRKIEIPKDAFAAMEKDFPELAQQTRAALEAALSGVPGTGAADVDATKIEGMLASYTSRREVEALEDAWPDWREIVGAVDVTKEQPNPDNPFRKWLGTKPAEYQARINGSESAQVIGRAIRLFQSETKAAPPKLNGTPRDAARAERIRSAVQPRGDNAGAAAGKSDDEEFEAGFNSR
jgi:hypothetical protein